MTDTKQPEALRKFQAIDFINTEEELEAYVSGRMMGLQQGYDAARLEIESLRARCVELELELERERAVAAEREACAKLVQDMSHHRRWVRAGINGEPIRPCEYAAAIRAEEERRAREKAELEETTERVKAEQAAQAEVEKAGTALLQQAKELADSLVQMARAIDREADTCETLTLGEFLMDHGWSQRDMDTSDEFGAVLLAAAPKAEPVQAGEYPPMPQTAIDAMLDYIYEHGTSAEGVKERIESMLRAYVDADRAMRAQAAPQPAVQQGWDIDAAVEKAWGRFQAAMDKDEPLPPPSIHATAHYGTWLGREAHWHDEPKAGAFRNAARMLAVLEAEIRRLHAELIAAQSAAPVAQGDAEDAARYRWLRRGQHWSVIDGIGDTLRSDELDAAIDAALAAQGGK